MNLKEAFRFQNKIESFMEEAECVLKAPDNITKVKETQLRSRAMAEAEDETTIIAPESPYADCVNDIVRFLLFLMKEKEKLFTSIRAAKNALPIDMDSEISLNISRQAIARIFQGMNDLRGSERILKSHGTGYKFNNEGNQVSYRCDVRRVITINFDRNVVRSELAKLNRRSDEVSAKVDYCMVTAAVDYETPFDVNLTFAEAFESFTEALRN
ncbi:MAG: hypothetical protein ILO68_04845 [Clostridia bacterium]|nr:hypothetical protein [Clostridia bacterium]